MAVSIVIDIKQNSQNIANNTSNITVKVIAKWTYGSYNKLEKSGSCTIDGTKYTFTSPFNTGQTTSGTSTLFTKTLNISHGADGTKTLSVSASYTSGVSSGTVSASASKTLTTIPRKSSLTVADGTLNTKQTLKITESASSMVHKLTYKCGSVSGYILGSTNATSSALSVDWIPPLDLARQNTTGSSVSITFYLYTYNGTTLIGINTYTKIFAIPSIRPSASVNVSDETDANSTTFYYVQGVSKLKVKITTSGQYGATIKSIKATFDGKTYTTNEFTTSVIAGSGTLPLVITVTDSRGQTQTGSFDHEVLPYTPPTISRVATSRCADAEGNGTSGNFLKIVLNSSVTALNNKNTATYKITCQAVGSSDSETFTITDFENQYQVTNGVHVIPADSSSAYVIDLTIEDAFKSVTKTVTVKKGSSAFKLWSILKHGLGICFGKVATLEKTVEFAMAAKFNEPVYGNVFGLNKLPEIPANSDLNTYMDTGCWAVYRNDNASTIANIPVARAGRLEVSSSTGEGIRDAQWSYLRQRYIPYNNTNAVWERDINRNESNVWFYGDWWKSTLTPEASEKVYSKSAMSVCLSSNTVLGAVNTYTKIPFSDVVLSTNNRLTLSSNAIRIGSNIQHIKVSGQVLVSPGSTDGLRHVRIQKVSNGSTSSIAWSTLNFTASKHLAHVLTPLIVSVKEGDLLQMVFYTGNANDSISSGTATNGWQTYLTVEEL